MIELPPSKGAANVNVTCPLPAPTTGCNGASGTVLGITAADATEAAPSPFALVAVTVHVYDFPFVRPPTTIGEPTSEADPAAPPFDDTQAAVNSLIALPPSPGATNDTLTCAFPPDTVGAAGADGTVLGITATDAAEGTPSPFVLVAITVHVYDLPFVRPPTTMGEPMSAATPATPPFDEMHAAENVVIGLPPSNGAMNDTLTCAFPPDTVGAAGGSGTVLGIVGADAGEGSLVPSPFVAVTVHVYVFPFDSDPTTIGEPTSEAAPATPPSDDTHAASYSVIALPPSKGAANDTVSCASPASTVGCAGAFGTSANAGDEVTMPTSNAAVTAAKRRAARARARTRADPRPVETRSRRRARPENIGGGDKSSTRPWCPRARTEPQPGQMVSASSGCTGPARPAVGSPAMRWPER